MAYSTRAYYEQTNNQDVLDRIEIQEDGFGGSAIQLQANDQGFKWRLSEITSESDKGLINPLANKIQVGKLTFFPRIETSAEQTLLDDILGSPDSQFRIVWKQDGDVFWTGNIDNKRRSHPETGGSYFATIRANDFEILQTIDYTSDGTPSGSLFLSRQTLITTISDLLGYLNFDLNIRTATSWITQDTTDSTDFLSQVNHETKALRRFGRTGDESDEPISVWDALEKIGGPALLFRQVNGEFTVEQLTEFDDPENVNETVYTSAGAVDTATTTVDRTLDADKATSEGNLVVKDGSPNDRYPAIKRATVTFDHRTKVSGIQFEDSFSLDSGDPTKPYTQFFLSDGNQQIEITGLIEGYFSSGHDDVTADIRIRIIRSGDDYFWDGSSWGTSGATISVDLIDSGRSTPQGQLHFNGFREFTDPAPSDADGTLEITFLRADSAASGFADTTTYRNAVFDIKNTVANENSTFINYQLTQSDGYATDFELQDTWFGDGPTGYALSALRSGSSDEDFIVDGWQRRGTTTGYRSFHEQLLKEIIDLQRSNTRKLNANFWGTYDPSKILVYDSQNFYCAGVSYIGHRGRWSANLFRVNLQTGSDNFEDIPKFSDEGSGTGSSGGGGGSTDTGSLDKRYFKINDNLSEGDPETMRGNLGLGAEDSVQHNNLILEGETDQILTMRTTDEDAIYASFFDDSTRIGFFGFGSGPASDFRIVGEEGNNVRISPHLRVSGGTSIDDTLEVDGQVAIGQSLSSATDLLDVDGAMRAETLRTNSGKFLSPTSYAFRNAGDTGFRNVEMASGTFNDLTTIKNDDLLNHLIIERTNFSPTSTWHLTPSAVSGTPHLRVLLDGESSTDGTYLGHGHVSIGERDPEGFALNVYDHGQFRENLYVRGGLFAAEFVVDQTRVMYNYSMSPEGGKIATVSGSAPNETITFEDEAGNEFVPVSEGSILQIQQRTGLSSGVIIKAIWRRVDDVTDNDVTLTDSGVDWDENDDVGSIESGDHAVQKGHATNTNLDGRIDFNVAGVDMPFISIFDGVDDKDAGFEAGRFGWTGEGDGVHEFDSSISGRGGIMGATEDEGAVFWITEEQARIAAFDFTEHYLTDGTVYIGTNLTNDEVDEGHIFIGEYNGLHNIRVWGETPADSYVGLFSRDDPADDIFRIRQGGQNVVAVSGELAQFFGANANDRYFWAHQPSHSGDPDPEDLSNMGYRFDAVEGTIFYPAMGGSSLPTKEAGLSEGAVAPDFNTEYYKTRASTGTPSTDFQNSDVKKHLYYIHTFGIRSLRFNANYRVESTTTGVTDEYVEMTVSGAGESANDQSSSSSDDVADVVLDVSDADPGVIYIIDIHLEAGGVSSSGAEPQDPSEVVAYLSTDIIYQEST